MALQQVQRNAYYRPIQDSRKNAELAYIVTAKLSWT
jgi:hypothetical protein